MTTDQYSKMASVRLLHLALQVKANVICQQTYSSGQVAIYLSLGCSKIATILLVRRLFMRNMKTAWTTCNTVVCAMFVWTIASAILVSAGCSAESLSSKRPSKMCSGIETRYMIVVVTDGITDLVLAVLPAYLCRRLQMNFIFKLQVLGIFALRLPLLALAGLFFKFWKSSLDSNDMNVTRTTALIFQQTQLCVSLIAGTIPCLRSFIQSFDTGSGVKAGFGHTNSSGYSRHSGVHHSSSTRNHNDESYQMSSLNQRIKDRPVIRVKVDDDETIRVDRRSSTMRLCADPEEQTVEMERRSTLESDRKSQLSTQELVIRKDVRWEITRETARKDSDFKL